MPAELEANPNEAELEEDGSCGEETDTNDELPAKEDIENADDKGSDLNGVLASNPYNTCFVKTDTSQPGKVVFDRFYMCLNALK